MEAKKIGEVFGFTSALFIFSSIFFLIIWKFKSVSAKYYPPFIILIEAVFILYAFVRAFHKKKKVIKYEFD